MKMTEETKDVSTTQGNTDAPDTSTALEDSLSAQDTSKNTASDTSTGDDKAGLPGDGDGDATDTNKAGLPGDDDKDSDKEKETSTENELKGAPEAYADFDISAGEEIGYSFTEEQTEAFKAFGKENNLDDKQMAGIVNFDIAREKMRAEANNKLVADMKTDGVKASRQKHGEKYSAMHAKNAQVYNKFFDEDTRTKLNDYGVSSMPGFFDALNAISSVLSEDVIVPGDAGGNDPSSRKLEDFFKT
jgi:hypothetical protein